MSKSISILGSTGSIGLQALDVARKMNFRVAALAARSSISALEEQAREFKPELVAVYDEECAKKLKLSLADTDIKVTAGMDGLCEAATLNSADTVLNSVVGMIGLTPTIAAIEADKEIALANKETLVTGGAYVTNLAKEHNVRILPVDSEHSAVFQSLQGNEHNEIKRIILTASGGPFFGKTREQLKGVTLEQALNHPNWSMGKKITIDSATMMNKGLEVIEARWLFDTPVEKIDVVVHRESIVHSMVEYTDNSIIAQLGVPDMRLPIQYALTYPYRVESDVQQLDFVKAGSLTFYEPDEDTFVCLKACKEALRRGGLAPTAANGANEMAVELFINGKISFLQIGELVLGAMNAQPDVEGIPTPEQIIECDKQAREYVLSNCTKGDNNE